MSAEKQRNIAKELFNEALEAANPKRCVLEHVSLSGSTLTVDSKEYDIESYDSIYLVAFGRAASLMASSVEELLGGRITEGIVISNSRPEHTFENLNFYLSSHPMPDDKSLQAAIRISSILDISSSFRASGFSTNTCFPCSRARIT